jgi:DNA-binding transcriptional MerR regulator
MNSGLKRRATFEEALYLPGPNLDLPQHLASQLIDSPYLIKQLGDDMGQTSERRAEEEDMARTVDRLAREHNVPIHELRGLVGSMRPGTQFDPFSGQAAHEARAAQAEVLASVEQQRIELARMYTEQAITRTTAAQLAQRHVDGLAEIAAALSRRRATSSGTR